MNIRGYVKLAVIFSFVFNSAFAADGTNDNQKNEATAITASSSRQAMLESMNDPIANKAFHDIQLDLLQTYPDSLLYSFFTKSTVFQPLYQFLVKNNEMILQSFEMYAKSNMVQVVKGSKHKHSYIDKLVVEVASNLGFTEEAIKNRQIYILGGDENAFTVSGSQSKIIVAFQRGILERMSKSELAAVLAHELGHIRAEHTIKGIMNSVMLEIVGELFVNGQLPTNNLTTDFSKIAHDNCLGVCVHSKSLLENKNIQDGVFKIQQSLNFKNGKQSIIDEKIQEFVANVANMPKEQLQHTVGSYLYTILQAAQIESAPPQTIQYFNTLLKNVGNIGSFKLNVQEYIAHAQMINFALSRSKEKTADKISASTIRNEYLASAFSKMLGLDFDKEYRPEIFSQIQKQAQEIYSTLPESQLSAVVGTTHPSLVLRIDTMLSIPTYPTVLFANNYLRLLLLNSSLIQARENAQAALNNFILEAQIANEVFELQMQGVEAEKVQEFREANEQRYAEIKKGMEENLARVIKSQLDQETRVLDLLFSAEHPIDGVSSPRMDNTIQYLSVQRENYFYALDGLKKEIAKLKSQKITDSKIEKRVAQNLAQSELQVEEVRNSLNNQKQFLQKIRDRIKEKMDQTNDPVKKDILKQRFSMLIKIVTAKTTLELEQIREAATTSPYIKNHTSSKDQTGYRRNKIPITLNSAQVSAPNYKGSVCSRMFSL